MCFFHAPVNFKILGLFNVYMSYLRPVGGKKYSFGCMLVQISISEIWTNMKNDGFLYGQISFLEKQAD